MEAGGGEEVEEGGALDDKDFYKAVNIPRQWGKARGLTVEAAVLVEEDSDCVLDDCTPRTTEHCRTTCTRGSPFFPTTGLNVTVHVSVASPAGLQRHQTANQHTQGTTHQREKKEHERVNRLHRLGDHCLCELIPVLLATVECLR